ARVTNQGLALKLLQCIRKPNFPEGQSISSPDMSGPLFIAIRATDPPQHPLYFVRDPWPSGKPMRRRDFIALVGSGDSQLFSRAKLPSGLCARIYSLFICRCSKGEGTYVGQGYPNPTG